MGIFNFLNKKNKPYPDFLQVDMHSHLLPGIDDGAATLKDSLFLIRSLHKLGYKKLITTPHIMSDFYKNTPEIIRGKLNEVRSALKKEALEVEIEAAAEYYLDECFIKKLENDEELLTFGDKYLLFETGFLNAPAQLNEIIFLMITKGYKPVFAHPERYTYLFSDFKKYEDLYARGLHFQLNLNSIFGYYSKPSQKIAEKLIEKDMVHFVGTDCHGERHLEAMKKGMQTKTTQKLAKLHLLNNTLL